LEEERILTININKAKIIDPLNDTRWDTFVYNHPYGTVYHHSSWMKVITLTHKHVRPLCFILEDEKSSIRAAIPCFIVKSKVTGSRIVSLPFTSYCDPLVSNKKDFIKLLDVLTNKLENISASYYELRVLRNQDLIKNDRLKCHNYHKTHILDIKGGFEKIKRSFHKDCIVRSVKKALKSGVIIRQGCSEQDLKEFYFVHALTRKRQGFPIQPYKFFKNMWEIMYPQGYFSLLLAKLDRKTVAGIVLFKFKDIISYEHGASIPDYLYARPNHLIMWRSIEMACAEGYHYFDFGKTPPHNGGLLNFKRRWGAKMYDIPYYYYPEIKGIMSKDQRNIKRKLIVTLEKHMPLHVAKFLGKIAYHHLG
jgi:lipid II:glycine glycyltransferase (peptidoglycan interpeptide bridge formation enzyme)